MADRTSADLFGKLFELLAKNPNEENKKIAKEMYKLSYNYDFSDYQMYADESCLKLGLCVKGINPEYPGGGEVFLYPKDEGFEKAKLNYNLD